MPKVTPLLRFLRALNKEQKETFASEVGTTYIYLHQLAAHAEPNPRLRLALAIRDASKRWAKRVMCEPLALEDLLVGTSEEESV